MEAATAIPLVLLALVVGAALPMLVQLFTTMRSMQKSIADVERRVDRALDDVSRAAGRVGHPATPTAAAIGAALGPAVVAAIGAFRAHAKPNGQRFEKEESHERQSS